MTPLPLLEVSQLKMHFDAGKSGQSKPSTGSPFRFMKEKRSG